MKKGKYTVTKWVWLPATIICILCIVRFLIPVILAFAPKSALLTYVSKYYSSSSFDTELCITIIGTAISVSIGLNIYNTIEKNELNELRLNAQRFETSISKAHEGERLTFLNLLLEVHGDAMMEHFFKVFSAKLTNPRTFKIYDEYITDLVSIQRTYVLAYNIYNSSPRGKTIESDTLIKTINTRSTGSTGENKLYDAYISFVTADMHYFMNECDEAIESYKKVIKRCSEIEEMNDPIVEIYLYNSIGWSHCRARKYGTALEAFDEMETAIQRANEQGQRAKKQGVNSSMKQYISRFYRNYGVCYENLAMQEDSNKDENLGLALKKYDLAIENWDSTSGEYKVFITFCSAKMKRWDLKYHKASFNWNKSAREGVPEKDIKDIESKLDIAQKLNPSYSDIYVQRAKALTYSLLINSSIDEKTKHAIDENIKTAEALTSGGVEYVMRDYYHALYLLSKYKPEKERYRTEVTRINQSILEKNKNNKEAQEFRETYRGLEQTKMCKSRGGSHGSGNE